MKTGRLSKSDWHFIEENADSMTVKEIAAKLGRGVDPIIKHLQKIGKTANKTKMYRVQAEYDLKSRPYWSELKKQFSEEELELFLYHWKEILTQFRKDVLPTEELQIIDTIKLEILMNRALRDQQQSMQRVSELEMMILATDDEEKETIYTLERQIASLRAAKESLSREFKDLQKKKSDMFKDLKATREQRIEKLESNKETMSGLIRKILKDPDFYEQQGKELERMRLAMENEKRRLGDYYKYGDGQVDRPLLNEETVNWEGEDD